jgi:purine nucleosidase
MEKYVMPGGPVHDASVTAYLLAPDLYRGREVHVEIDIGTGPTQGMTIVDWWGVTSKPSNALVMNQVDADGFFDLIVERISRLP